MAVLNLIPLIVLLVGFLLIARLVAISRRPGPERPDEGDGSDGGGGRPDLPVPPRPRGGDGEPSWWPEFEREFRAYADRRLSRACSRDHDRSSTGLH